jgi:hypothetical protein
MHFKDVPQFPRAHYEIDISWGSLEEYLNKEHSPSLELEPDYQRGHVWNKEQRTAYIEYGLMGGEKSMDITTNCPGWMGDFRGPWELVDGLQRVTAVRMFLANKVKAFGLYHDQFEGKLTLVGPSFRLRVLSLATRKEVLNLYLLLNSGGVVHSKKELDRVKALLSKEA